MHIWIKEKIKKKQRGSANDEEKLQAWEQKNLRVTKLKIAKRKHGTVWI
jgi:hypothetical protein